MSDGSQVQSLDMNNADHVRMFAAQRRGQLFALLNQTRNDVGLAGGYETEEGRAVAEDAVPTMLIAVAEAVAILLSVACATERKIVVPGIRLGPNGGR